MCKVISIFDHMTEQELNLCILQHARKVIQDRNMKIYTKYRDEVLVDTKDEEE